MLDCSILSPKPQSKGLIAEEGVWRDVEVVDVGDVLRGLSARALVWGYVPSSPPRARLCIRYCSNTQQQSSCGIRRLGTRRGQADGSTIVVEVRASALLEGREGWVRDVHAFEVVRGLTAGPYVKQAEEVPADCP